MLDSRLSPWLQDVARVADLGPPGSARRGARRRVSAGTWQRPLPGVVCRTTGALTSSQQLIAALKYAGPGAVISHYSAGEFWSFGRWQGAIHVTVPHGRRVRSLPGVVIFQSRRPLDIRSLGDLDVTAPARTAIDMALGVRRQSEADAIIGRAMQGGRVSIDQLASELDLAPSRGSRRARIALADAGAGSRAASEAELLRLLRKAGLPLPELNAAVATSIGERYVDALWRHLRKGVEVDGARYHFDVVSWQDDLRRQNAIQATGIVLLRIPARRLWVEPQAVMAEIAAFLGVRS